VGGEQALRCFGGLCTVKVNKKELGTNKTHMSEPRRIVSRSDVLYIEVKTELCYALHQAC
jgi:hypothetical protein